MVKGILGFIVLFLLFFVGIKSYRHLTKQDKWNIAKTFGYSLLAAAASISVLVTIVVLF